MIVRNEAQHLARCLQSTRAVVDETIVVDTGSTDDTLAIAQAHHAQVYSIAWPNDFAVARNISLQYATGEWILVLDADEVLVPGCVPSLQEVLQQPDILVVNLIRHEVGASQSPYSLLSRLFRRHPNLRFSRPYHETVDDSATQLLQHEPQWKVFSLSGVAIAHEGYQADAIATRDKFNRARTAMEAYLAKNPEDAYICSKLGGLYVQAGTPTHGVALLKRGLHIGPTEPSILYELHYHFGLALTHSGQIKEAEAQYAAAIAQSIPPPLKLGAYVNLGSLLKNQGNLEGAQALYLAVLDIAPDFAMGHYNLGLTLKAMGNLTAAIAHYRRAINLEPNYAEAHQNLGVVLFKVGQIEEGLREFTCAIDLYEVQGSPDAQRLRQGIKDMGFEV
jgi:tetratricopeptide (TPR) repeat protein